MTLLSTFFPKRARSRTVVHAGPLVLRHPGGAGALRRYLRIPRKREVFLVHHGQPPLREVARATGVADINLDSPTRQEANVATEMALALGARQLDFTIDEPGVAGPSGEPLPELTLREAETLARNPVVRPRIRAKLRAGCVALRQGISRVRIGDPAALTRDRATRLVRDPDAPVRAQGGARQPRDPAAPEQAAPCAQPPWRLAWRVRDGRRRGAGPESTHADSAHRAPADVEASADASGDPWWRLRGSLVGTPAVRLEAA